MTLIKKRDVKEYFAARRLKGGQIHIVPTGKPGTTGLPDKVRAPAENATPGFDQDFIADHSSSSCSTGPKTAKAPAALGRESL